MTDLSEPQLLAPPPPPGLDGPAGAPAADRRGSSALALAVLGAGLLVAGAALFVVALFFDQAPGVGPMSGGAGQIIPDVVVAAGWLVAAALTVPSATRPGGAALAVGVTLAEVGLVIADLGELPGPLGTGSVLVALGLAAAALGAVAAALAGPRRSATDRPARVGRPAWLIPLIVVAAIVLAVALLPAWDRYVVDLRAADQSRVLSEGSAFAASTPTTTLAGDIVAAFFFAVVPTVAAFWRPARVGVLAAAAVVVVVAGQIASAVVSFSVTNPLYLGFSTGDVSSYGIVVRSSALTAWYDVEVVAALALAVLLMARWWTPDAAARPDWQPTLWAGPPWWPDQGHPGPGGPSVPPLADAAAGPSPWAPPQGRGAGS